MTESVAGPSSPDAALVILIPVFNDWAAVGELLIGLDHVLASKGVEANVLIVDDGSSDAVEPGTVGGRFVAFGRVTILPLRRNLGHQRAIAIGLAYVEAKIPCRAVVLMDSDGEDDPEDVPRLLESFEREGCRKIIFAERVGRSESAGFRVGYAFYRGLHRVLTGISVRVGNFSVVPRERLACLVTASEMWNHFAAAVFVSRQPFTSIPTRRARRLAGRSKMRFVNLVVHGLSAISASSEIVGVRLLIGTAIMIAIVLIALAITVTIRLTTDLAIPGWASTVFGVLLILLSQATMFLFVFSFMILAGRNGASFLPSRDYVYFVGREKVVFER